MLIQLGYGNLTLPACSELISLSALLSRDLRSCESVVTLNEISFAFCSFRQGHTDRLSCLDGLSIEQKYDDLEQKTKSKRSIDRLDICVCVCLFFWVVSEYLGARC